MEELNLNFLSQIADSITKLFEITTRIDERVKVCIDKNKEIESKIENVHKELSQRISNNTELNLTLRENLAILNSKNIDYKLENVKSEIHLANEEILFLKNRLSNTEKTSEGFENKWNAIVKFIVQIIWLVVGAWILFKLGLGPPSLP